MEAQIQIRRSTAAQWISANPVLASGEPGLETDTRKGKYGDGVTHWNTLDYSWSLLGGGPVGAAGGSLAGTYPNPSLALNVVGAPQIIDGGVGNAELAANAVTGPKIADGSVTGPKLADGSITGAKLAPGGIGSAQIADGSIAVADLAPATIQALMVDVYDEGAPVLSDVGRLNFVGEGVDVSTASGVVTVSITGAPASAILPGTISEWANPVPPAGWYLCDGSVKADMAGTVGTRYGANGQLPNYFPVATDYSTTTTADVVSGTQPGWSIPAINARRHNGYVLATLQATRTGATIDLNQPNHSDQAICSIQPAWRPDFSVAGACLNAAKWGYLSSPGTLVLSAGFANSISNDSSVLRDDVFTFSFSYPAPINAGLPSIYRIIKHP